MKLTAFHWKYVTHIIPPGYELVCEKAVATDHNKLGSALCRVKPFGVYMLVNSGVSKGCDQREAKEFVYWLKENDKLLIEVEELL